MKLTTGILAVAMMTGAAWGQNPDAVDNARSVAKSLQQIKTNQTNAALDAGEPASSQAAKPEAGSPAKPATGPQSNPAPATKAGKPHDAFLPKQPAVGAAKLGAPQRAAKPEVASGKITVNEKPAVASKGGEAAKAPKPEEKKWAMTGKRDPFFSPVLQPSSGSGCSTGKKCLEIGQINVRGVVKSESGFIAVVTNSLNKAYFLHENDPVFNGYVVRITGDSVVFQETVQDKLGKPLTHEVVKRIFTPAV
jgi:type II secretory pathway pseudopilin PulG